jgi:coatomer subunit epsilon
VSALNAMAGGAGGDGDEEHERLAWLYRTYSAQRKWSLVLDELKVSPSTTPPLLQAVRLEAELLNNAASDDCGRQAELVEELVQLAANSQHHPTVTLVVAEWCLAIGSARVEDALRLLHPLADVDLDCAALQVEALLRVHRVDLAQHRVDRMKTVSEDAVPTQLAEAAVSLFRGGDHAQNAFYIYQELIETYGSTPKLLVGQAASYVLMHKFPEAFQLLQEAHQKSSAGDSDADVVAALALINRLRGTAGEQAAAQYASLLASSAFNVKHTLVMDVEAKSKQFDQLAGKFGVRP